MRLQKLVEQMPEGDNDRAVLQALGAPPDKWFIAMLRRRLSEGHGIIPFSLSSDHT